MLALLSALLVVPLALAAPYGPDQWRWGKLRPKVFVVTMFAPEETAWTHNMQFANNFTVPGLSPLHPEVHCDAQYAICHISTGEGEINAAVSVASLLLSGKFDFSRTFWLLNGIGGGDPGVVTTGSVTFARFAVQVGLQYQIDSREVAESHPEWPTGYFSYGTKDPWTYPDSVYGTEVFELNEKLRNRALEVAARHQQFFSEGDEHNVALRKLYDGAGAQKPRVEGCDVLTSDNYWHGAVLSDFFANYTAMVTNGTAVYCSAAQEENATLMAFLRHAKFGLVDFGRIIVMRSISNFVRAPASLADDPVRFFVEYEKGGIGLSLDNLFVAGSAVVHDIVDNWTDYDSGQYAPDNYIGDIFGTLGGKPDFGKEEYTVRGVDVD